MHACNRVAVLCTARRGGRGPKTHQSTGGLLSVPEHRRSLVCEDTLHHSPSLFGGFCDEVGLSLSLSQLTSSPGGEHAAKLILPLRAWFLVSESSPLLCTPTQATRSLSVLGSFLLWLRSSSGAPCLSAQTGFRACTLKQTALHATREDSSSGSQ